MPGACAAQGIPPPSFPPHLVIPAQAGASADGTSIQKGRARTKHPAPFAPSERGACKRSEHAGYARGGDPLSPPGGRPPGFHHLRRQETYRPPSLQRKGDAGERSETAGGCPGRRGQAIPPPRHSRARRASFSARNGNPEGQSEGKPPAPFAPSERGASERSDARGVCPGRRGRARPPNFHHLRRHPHRPPSLQRKGDAGERSETAGGCPGWTGIPIIPTIPT